MSDYNSDNNLLAPTLKSYLVGNMLTYSEDSFYLFNFQSTYYMAVYNNYEASKLANGFGNYSSKFLQNGIASRMENILASKIVGNISFEGNDSDVNKFEKVLSKNRFAREMNKAIHLSLKSGRCVIVLNYDKKGVIFSNYSLFRSQLTYDNLDNIIKAELFVTCDDSDYTAGYTVKEVRYYGDDGFPYQKYIVNKISHDAELSSSNKAQIFEYEDDVPIDIQRKFPDIAFNKSVRLFGDSIGVYAIDNTAVNNRYPNTNCPETQFMNIEDEILELFSAHTYKETDKFLGRGRVLVDQAQTSGAPTMSPTITNNSQFGNVGFVGAVPTNSVMDNTIMVGYSNGKSLSEQAPISVQFDLRTDEWVNEINNNTARIVALYGLSILDYDPRLLQEGQRTDDEINAMTDITANTVLEKHDIIADSINNMLNDIAGVYGINQTLFVRFAKQPTMNPLKLVQYVSGLKQIGSISEYDVQKILNPNATEKEIQEKLARINSENKPSMPTLEDYNNFGGNDNEHDTEDDTN